MVWSMWSNALLKSKRRILTYCFSIQTSVALLQWWYSSTMVWTVELPLLQPYWVGSTSTPTLSQIHFITKDSYILLTTGVRDIRCRSFSSLLGGGGGRGSLYVYIRICLFCIWVYGCVCLHICLDVCHVCMSMCICLCGIYVCMHVYVYMSMCICLCVYVCMHVYVCMFMCLCICVYVFLCVCVCITVCPHIGNVR